MINQENYKKYLDDFIAGKLDPVMEESFVLFLDSHPGILEESAPFFEMETPSLDEDFLLSLKKNVPVNDGNINDWLIAELEGDLPASDQKELDLFVGENKAYEKDRQLYQLTRLDAKESILYPGKESLKKRPVFVLYPVLRVAAAIILLAALWFVFRPGHEEPVNPVAHDKKPAHKNDAVQTEPELAVAVNPPGDKQTTTKELINPGSAETPAPDTFFEEIIVPVPGHIVTLHSKNPQVKQPEIQELPALAFVPENNGEIPSQPAPAVSGRTLTPLEWAYKQVRKKVSGEYKNVPKEEIPKDITNMLVQSISPAIAITDESIRIGGVTLHRPGQSSARP